MVQQASNLNGSKGFDTPPAQTCASAQKQKRRALVVGINAYPAPNALSSCVMDARVMSGLLRSDFGFEDQIVLLDEEASKANLTAGLSRLLAGCGSADRLAFFFSGHGYRPVRNGVLESALVTQDAEFFEDHELADLMKDVPPGILTIITDACFSGGMEKLFVRANGQIEVAKLKRWISLDPRQVESHRDHIEAVTRFSPFGYLSPVSQSALQANVSFAKGTAFEITQLRQSDSKAILVSACLEDETAAASTSQTQGLSAFTYALTSTIGSLGSAPSAQAVIEAAGRRLREIGIKQTPMLKTPPQPAALAIREFILINETGGASPTRNPLNVTPIVEQRRDAEQQAVARAITTILLMTGEVNQIQPDMQQKDWTDIVRAVVPIALAQQSMGFTANGNGAADKDFIGDAGRVANTLSPFLQSKGCAASGNGAANKDWTDIVRAVVPIALALQSKGFTAGGNGAVNKDWIDDAGRIAGIVVPIVASLQSSKGFAANGNGAASKDFLGDVVNIVRTVGPLVAGMQSKGWDDTRPLTDPGIGWQPNLQGFQTNGSTSADKDFLDDVARITHIVTTVAPIIAAT